MFSSRRQAYTERTLMVNVDDGEEPRSQEMNVGGRLNEQQTSQYVGSNYTGLESETHAVT